MKNELVTSLLAFVRGRLLDREVLAMAATNGPWESLDHGDRLISPYGADGEEFEYVLTSEPAENGDDADYVAAHHPAWTLADIAAKSLIVDTYEGHEQLCDGSEDSLEAGITSALYFAVVSIATVDQQHPAYDQRWLTYDQKWGKAW